MSGVPGNTTEAALSGMDIEDMSEWICETCVNYPPSSLSGKPCCTCDPDDPLLNCYQRKEPDFDLDLFIECAKRYGAEVSKCKPGSGGVYVDGKKITAKELFNETELLS